MTSRQRERKPIAGGLTPMLGEYCFSEDDGSVAVIEKIDDKTYMAVMPAFGPVLEKMYKNEDEQAGENKLFFHNYKVDGYSYSSALSVNEARGMAQLENGDNILLCYSDNYDDKGFGPEESAGDEFYDCGDNGSIWKKSGESEYRKFDKEKFDDTVFYKKLGGTINGSFFYKAPQYLEKDGRYLYIDKGKRSAVIRQEGNETVCRSVDKDVFWGGAN